MTIPKLTRPLLSVAACLALTPALHADPPDPVARWDFESNAGATVVDRTGNGHDGTAFGSPTWVASSVAGGSSALLFGPGNAVNVPSSQNLLPGDHSFALSAWFRTSATGVPQTITWAQVNCCGNTSVASIDPTSNTVGWTYHDDRIVCCINPEQVRVVSPGAVTDGEWHHVVAVRDRDAGEAVLYLDGVEVDSAPDSQAVVDTTSTFGIGYRPPDAIGIAERFFQGLIDELKIYDQALSPEQVYDLCTAEEPSEGICQEPLSLPFGDDFDDGDFTNDPDWSEFNPDDAPGLVEVVGNELHIFRDAPPGNGGGVGLVKTVDFPVTPLTQVKFDGRPVSRNVVNGCGFDCAEYPVLIFLTLETLSGDSVRLLYGLNYGGAVADRDWPGQRLRALSVPQDVWTRDVTFLIQDIWPDAARIREIQLIGTGWDFEGYIDNFSISEPSLNQAPLLTVASPTSTVAEGATATNFGTFDDPNPGDTVALSSSIGAITTSGGAASGSWNWTYPALNGPDQSQTVTVTADDGAGGIATIDFDVVVANVAPTVVAVVGPTDPLELADNVASLTVDFTDPGVLDTHACTFDWDDGAGASPGTVAESGGSGSCTGTHSYAATGVYSVTATVMDDDGGVDTATFEYIVVFDPAGGFVTGAGQIDSPLGAYVDDPTLEGRAHFGFQSKYQPGANVPTGNTSFRFKVADFKFESVEYQWLVIAGAKAQFKGTGAINGAGTYGFLLTARDSAQPGGGSADAFRIKIWDATTDAIVYDNNIAAGDDIDDASPTEIAVGSIVVHTQQGPN